MSEFDKLEVVDLQKIHLDRKQCFTGTLQKRVSGTCHDPFTKQNSLKNVFNFQVTQVTPMT